MMPFAGGIQETANATLIFSIAAAVVYGIILDTRPTLLQSGVRTLAVGLLGVLAALQGGSPLLVAALALCAAGDALLSREDDKPFLLGLASFLAAHLLYVALFGWSGGGAALLLQPWRAALTVVIAVAALAMLALLWPRVGPALRVPIVVYIAANAAMAVSALTMGNFMIVAGAVLFVASTCLLGSERFLIAGISRHRDWMRHAVWALYYAAQLLITLGFLVA